MTRTSCRAFAALTAGLVVGASANAQVVFFEDFGTAQERVSSAFVPSAGVDTSLGFYQFSESGSIRDGWYAILPPHLLSETGADNYWTRITEDHTPGDTNGALMVLNAGDKFNQFYRRHFDVEPGKSYRISVWRYVVNASRNGPIFWDLEVQNVNSETLLGNSGNIANTALKTWEESFWDFTVPANCTPLEGRPLQASMALRNKSPVTSGNDIYIDDISVSEITGPATEIECPTERIFTVEALDDSAQTRAGESVGIPLIENDSAVGGSGAPGNQLNNDTLRVVGQPANGTVTVNPDGSVTYQPEAGFSGQDQFEYEICNDAPTPSCDTATATVDVLAPPAMTIDLSGLEKTAPQGSGYASTFTCANAAQSAPADPASCAVSNLPAGLAVTGCWIAPPVPAQAWVSGTGRVEQGQVVTCTVSGTLNEVGTTEVTGTTGVAGAVHGTDTAVITATARPAAADDLQETDVNTPVPTDTTTPPPGGSVSIIDPPAHGTLTPNPDGTFTYTPDPAHPGVHRFTYQVCDSANVCSDPATVTVRVRPVAEDRSVTTPQGKPVDTKTTTPPSNGRVVPGTKPPEGTVSTGPNESLVYTPDNASFTGEDQFTYRICVGQGADEVCSEEATVTVSIYHVAATPVPAMGVWGLGALSGLLAVFGLVRRRRDH